EYTQRNIPKMEGNVMSQTLTSVETPLPNANATANQDRNGVQDDSSILKVASTHISQSENADKASAKKIASAFRHYRNSREKQGKILSARSRDKIKKVEVTGACLHLPGTCEVWSRWEELLDIIVEQIHRRNNTDGPLNTNQKLELAVSVVERIGKGSSKNHLWLILDTEHWLEICDAKHRYGSNLKVYHDYWLHTNTQENFFEWLDGAGKDVSFESCTRSKLEEQRVKYLSPEERLDYEVTFKDGLLIYKKSEKPVHTNPSSTSAETSENDINVLKSPAPNLSGSPKESKDKQPFSHPTHNRNDSEASNSNVAVREKWIYVTDCEERFYVGRKQKGHFHHSSFLAGGAICAAGGIKVDQGKLLEINPNSGHYKPAQRHFKALIERLRNGDVDLDSNEVKVVYPNDILEQHLMEKYKIKRLVDLNIAYDAVVRDAGQMVNQQFDTVDRKFTKASNVIKKNMKSLLREYKDSLRVWASTMNSQLNVSKGQVGTNTDGNHNSSGSTSPNIQPTFGVRGTDKTKSKHERKFSGFLQEILTGVVLFFLSPVDVKNAALVVKKDNGDHVNDGGSVILPSGGSVNTSM
ncbi:7381_t:CDS:2, partial [Acaulospora colombiana]